MSSLLYCDCFTATFISCTVASLMCICFSVTTSLSSVCAMSYYCKVSHAVSDCIIVFQCLAMRASSKQALCTGFVHIFKTYLHTVLFCIYMYNMLFFFLAFAASLAIKMLYRPKILAVLPGIPKRQCIESVLHICNTISHTFQNTHSAAMRNLLLASDKYKPNTGFCF